MAFLHPYFLLLGLFAAVPVIIHLFDFHRYKKVIFTNVKLLRELTMTEKQENRLYRRLLLLFRCLVILFLALLFSQPYIKSEDSALKGKGSNAVVIIVDNSFSMQNLYSKGSMLEGARSKAKEILDEYSDNDSFCLLTMDLDGAHRHFTDKKTCVSMLKDVSISASSRPYSELINTAHHLLSMRSEDNKRVFLVSDFQKKAFDAENIKTDSLVRDVFLPMEAKNISNVYIDSLLFERNIYTKGAKVDMKVRVCNCSDEKKEKLAVKLYIDGTQQSIATVDIPEYSSVEVPVSFVLNKSGILSGKVQIMDDPVTYDDDFLFTITLKDGIRALSVNGSEPNKYISRLFSKGGEVALDNVSEKNMDYSVLGDYNTVILNGVTDFSSGMAFSMKNIVENGASLVILPDRNSALSYTNALKQLHLPYYSSFVENGSRVTQIESRTELMKNVFTSVTDNMEMPEVKKYFRINASGAAMEKIMQMADGSVFLSQTPVKSGKVFMFAAPMDENYTDMPKQSIFVPVFWNIALYSSVLPKPFLFTDSDEFFDLRMFLEKAKGESVTLVNKDTKESFIPMMVFSQNRLGFKLNNCMSRKGIYEVKDGEKTIGAIALNYPRVESDLRFLSASDIKKIMKASDKNNYEVFNDRKMLRTYFEKSKSAFDFSWILLSLVVVFVVAAGLLERKINR